MTESRNPGQGEDNWGLNQPIWDDIEEEEPDAVDFRMLAEAEEDPDCKEFVSEEETLKALGILGND